MNAFTDFPLEDNDRHTEIVGVAGQTALTTDFPVYTNYELRVVRQRGDIVTTLILNTDYSVTGGVGNPVGFTLTLAVPAEAGDLYAIDGLTDFERSSDYPAGQALSSDALNGDMDRSVMRDQELRRAIDLLQDQIDDLVAVVEGIVTVMNTNRLLGRTSPGFGPPEEVVVGEGLILGDVP